MLPQALGNTPRLIFFDTFIDILCFLSVWVPKDARNLRCKPSAGNAGTFRKKNGNIESANNTHASKNQVLALDPEFQQMRRTADPHCYPAPLLFDGFLFLEH